MRWLTERRFRTARIWSNAEVRKLGHLFCGSAVNVSGWDDRDKEGSHYRSYFPQIDSYCTTNFRGDRGVQGVDGEIFLDLEQPLPDELRRRFNLVFNHTTLEHIFDVFGAFHNLCQMSDDAVLIIVPFAQVEHYTQSFGDYWRFTPQALRMLFEREGMELVYASVSNEVDAAIYVLALGVCDPTKWVNRLPPFELPATAGSWIGRPSPLARLAHRLSRLTRSQDPR